MYKYEPYKPPVKAPVKAPVKVPIKPPVKSAVKVPVQIPVKPPVKTKNNPYAKMPGVQDIKDEDYDAQVKEAVNLHKQGVDGDKDAVKKACELLKKLHWKRPEDVLVEGYLGSSTSLLGRDVLNPIDRMNQAIRGLKLLDHAVAQEPENLELRTLRGNVCLKLPEMYFHRTGTAIEDLSRLISSYEKDESLFLEETYWNTLFDLGTAYKTLNRTEDAQKVWDRLLSVSKDDKYRRLVAQAGLNTSGQQQNTYHMAQAKPAEQQVKNKEAADKEVKDKEIKGAETPKHLAEAQVTAANPDGDGRKKEAVSGTKKKIDEIIELHSSAFNGYREDAQRAFEIIEKAYLEAPDDPVIAAYYADCTSLLGKNAYDSYSMFGNAIKAIKLYDDLVNRYPDSIEVRLLRGIQSYRLPESFFRRTATAVTDFEYLLHRYEEGGTILPKEFYSKILYLLGKAYQRLGLESESRTTWQKLLTVSDDSRYSSLVAKETEAEAAGGEAALDMSRLSDKELFKEGKRLHSLAMEGDKKAAQKASEILQKVYEANPGVPAIEAYYGSSMALVGRYSQESQSLFGGAIKGMKLLNHAVESASDNLKLRYLRSRLLFNLPEAFFHTGEKACADFRYLIDAFEKDNSAFPREHYWQMLYDLGVCCKRLGYEAEADKAWNKLLKVSSDPKYKSLLNGKEG